MAIRRIESHGELGCLERIEYLSPEGEWVQHPTRGSWQPCGTYARTSASDNLQKEKITVAPSFIADEPCPYHCPDNNVEAIVRDRNSAEDLGAKHAVDLGKSIHSIQRQSMVAYLPGQEPEDPTDETPKQEKKKSFPWLFLVAALVVGYFILFRK